MIWLHESEKLQEIKSDAVSSLLVDVHDPINTYAVWIAPISAATRFQVTKDIAYCQPQRAPLEQISRAAADHRPEPPAEGKWAIDIATYPNARLPWPACQTGPETLHRGPEDFHILIDNRSIEKTGSISDRGGGRKALMRIEGRAGTHGFLVAREHEEGGAEDVEGDGQARMTLIDCRIG